MTTCTQLRNPRTAQRTPGRRRRDAESVSNFTQLPIAAEPDPCLLNDRTSWSRAEMAYSLERMLERSLPVAHLPSPEGRRRLRDEAHVTQEIAALALDVALRAYVRYEAGAEPHDPLILDRYKRLLAVFAVVAVGVGSPPVKISRPQRRPWPPVVHERIKDLALETDLGPAMIRNVVNEEFTIDMPYVTVQSEVWTIRARSGAPRRRRSAPGAKRGPVAPKRAHRMVHDLALGEMTAQEIMDHVNAECGDSKMSIGAVKRMRSRVRARQKAGHQ
jgi:hypothetical protein